MKQLFSRILKGFEIEFARKAGKVIANHITGFCIK